MIEKIVLGFNSFFGQHNFLIIYLFVINIITFVCFGLDKYAANNNKWRIRNITLFGLAFIGGTIGGLIAMYIFRHKTQKYYYTIGLRLMIIIQIILLVFLFN